MDAIETRYVGASNFRPQRIIARTLSNNRQSITVNYDHTLNATENHQFAARTLLHKLGWADTTFIGGFTVTGYVWVDVNDNYVVHGPDSIPKAAPKV